ncbi:MAG: dihydrolipoyl dehydrogenase [Phycisphaeraceae bacterium]
MSEHDLIIIGAGPGGYVAAIKAAQLGLDTACIDAHAQLGGTCLRVGCIPSKAMLESSHAYEQARNHLAEHGVKVGDVQLDLPAMHKRRDKITQTLTGGIASLFKKNGVTRYQGHGRCDGPGKVVVRSSEGEITLKARRIIIATGSVPATLPGIEFDGQRIASSTEALTYDKVPEHLVVIGAGYIGLEMGSVWRRLGAKVTVLEFLDYILPTTDRQIADAAQTLFAKQGITFRLGAKVTGAKVEKDKVVVSVEKGDAVECDRVLMAVGRKPNTEKLNLESIGVKTNDKGFITVDEHFQTQARDVYAIGDVIRQPMLAHKAEDEGIACVERIVTGFGHVNYDVIPAVVYTHPEIASVGRTEEECKARDIDYNKGVFPFRANGRARTLNDVEGMVKILADQKTDRVLGVHILGGRAGDMIAEAAAAMEYGATSEDIARTCHAHPTLSEAMREAAMSVTGKAIHF